MKFKYLSHVLVLALGLLAGWWLFSDGHSGDHDHGAHAGEVEAVIYTCSMHPQIRQAEPGKCPLCAMDLTPLLSSSGDTDPALFEMSPAAIALANIQTIRVAYADAEKEIQLNGKVKVNEQRIAAITANFAGRVEKLYVNFTGQEVRRGEKLAIMYSPELLTAQRELLEASRWKGEQPALYQAAREKLRLWKIADAQIDALEQNGEVQPYFDVYADQSGVVIERLVSVGQYLERGSVLFEVADLSAVWILLDAYEADLPWINKGAKVTFTATALPGEERQVAITYIDPMINPLTRVAAVRAETSNPSMRLKPEMFVQAIIRSRLPGAGKALAIPRTALLWTGKRSVVYVKMPDTEAPTFTMREITLGPRLGELYLVSEGLEEGEEIVTNGVFALDAAAQLSDRMSMMNRPAQERDVPPPTADLSGEATAAFSKQLEQLVRRYLELKDALVLTDAKSAANAAKTFLTVLDKVESQALGLAARPFWNENKNNLRAHGKMIADEKDVERQRRQFEFVSDLMIQTVQAFGAGAGSLYVQHCPMAFDDQGADWLSAEADIRNPYFGDLMLKCGFVKEEISAGAPKR